MNQFRPRPEPESVALIFREVLDRLSVVASEHSLSDVDFALAFMVALGGRRQADDETRLRKMLEVGAHLLACVRHLRRIPVERGG